MIQATLGLQNEHTQQAMKDCIRSTRNLEQFNTKPPSTHLHQAFLFQRRGFGEVTLFDCAGQAVVAATTRW